MFIITDGLKNSINDPNRQLHSESGECVFFAFDPNFPIQQADCPDCLTDGLNVPNSRDSGLFTIKQDALFILCQTFSQISHLDDQHAGFKKKRLA